MATVQEALAIAVRHHQAGELSQAEQIYRQILDAKPDHAHALHLLGVIAHQVGNQQAAIELISRATAIEPQNPDYYNNLGNALTAQGKHGEAVSAFRRALQIKPDYAAAHYNLGNALTEEGKVDEAMACYERAVEIKPDYADAHYKLGSALHEQGQWDEAVACYRRALRLKPDSIEAHNNLGIALQAQRQLDEAVACYQRVLQIKPDSVAAHVNLGSALQAQGQLDEAVACYQRVLQLKPDSVAGHNNLGSALREQGQPDESVACYQRALRINPDCAEANFGLSDIKKYKIGDPQIERIERLLADGSTSDQDRIPLNFTLSKAYDDLGDYDRAFRRCCEANQLRRQEVEYDPASQARFVSALVDFFTSKRFAALGDSMAIASDVPIFIVGMPRSGTTLVEQVLASHPDVIGAGELKHVSQLMKRLPSLATSREEFPFCLTSLPTGVAKALAKEYLERLCQLAPKEKHVTDKMPGNFFLLGLVALLWPKSSVVHCRRDPMAVGLSCYRRRFATANEFSWDLAEIGHYWRQYDRLWRCWQQVLPIPVLELQYEHLVERPEEQIRRLVDYCGLAWDDRCLDFHRTRRTVRTNAEVRRPIYRDALEHWRHYEHHLEPLKKALAGELEP